MLTDRHDTLSVLLCESHGHQQVSMPEVIYCFRPLTWFPESSCGTCLCNFSFQNLNLIKKEEFWAFSQKSKLALNVKRIS